MKLKLIVKLTRFKSERDFKVYSTVAAALRKALDFCATPERLKGIYKIYKITQREASLYLIFTCCSLLSPRCQTEMRSGQKCSHTIYDEKFSFSPVYSKK